MKKLFLSVIFILLTASASMAAVGASSWAPDGSKLCGYNYLSGYGIADGLASKGIYLFVTQPSGTLANPAFSARFIHVNPDGSIANGTDGQEIDKSLPSGTGSRFQTSGTAFKVAVLDAANSPIAAWARIPNVSGSTTKEIFIQKFDSGGNYKWSNPVSIFATTPSFGISDYCVESDTQDGAIAVFSATFPADNRLLARRVDSSGVRGQVLTITIEANKIENILTAPGGADYFWVVWQVNSGGNTDAIKVKKVPLTAVPADNPNAVLAAPVYTIASMASNLKFGTSVEQSICSDGNGGLVLAWSENDHAGSGKKFIYSQRIDSNANFYPALGLAGLKVFGDLSNDQTSPVIDRIDTDHVLIACSSVESNSSINIYGAKIQISNFSAGGINWKNKISTSGMAAFPMICADGSGNAFAGYFDGRNETNLNKLRGWFYYNQRGLATSEWTANIDIYAKRISTNGTDMWSQGDIPLSRAPNIQLPKQIINIETGKAAAYWIDTRDSASDPNNIIGHTSTEAQQLILAYSSIYGAKIGDAGTPSIKLNKVNGFNYSSGMAVLQDSPCTLEGVVSASDSTFSNNSTMEIAWDGGAAESVSFTPNSLYNQAAFSVQKTLAGGAHSFVMNATDDYGSQASALSGTLTATNELIYLSNLKFDNSTAQCSVQPKLTGDITVTDDISSVLDPANLAFTTRWDSGTTSSVPTSDVTITKSSQTKASFSFTNPTTLPVGQHVCLLAVKDIYNNSAQITGYVEVPAPSQFFAGTAAIQNGQLVLSLRSATQLPDSFTVSIFSPAGPIKTLVANSQALQSAGVGAKAASGYVTYKWPADSKLNNLAKGIYPIVLSTGEKIYLIKNF